MSDSNQTLSEKLGRTLGGDDRGAGRSMADALQIPKKLAEVARLAVTVAKSGTGSPVTDGEVRDMADLLWDAHEALMEACPTVAKTTSSAGVRLAACVADVFDGLGERSRRIYRDMVLAHFSDLPPVGLAFMAQIVAGKIPSGGGTPMQFEILARALEVFDPAKANNSKIQVKDKRTGVASLRERLNERAHG